MIKDQQLDIKEFINLTPNQRKKATRQNVKKLKFLLETNLQKFDVFSNLMEKTFDVSKFIETLDRMYMMNHACMGEILYLIDLWDLSDISDGLNCTIKAYRNIYEGLIEVLVDKIEELQEMKNSTKVKYIYREKGIEGHFPSLNSKEMDEARTKQKEELEKMEISEQEKSEKLKVGPRKNIREIVSLLGDGKHGVEGYKLNFSDQNEFDERMRKNKEMIAEKVKQLCKQIEKGEEVDYSEIKDPRITIEINNMIYKLMLNDTIQNQNVMRKALQEFERKEDVKLEAPMELNRIIHINKKTLEMFNFKSLANPKIPEMAEMKKEFEENEIEILEAFDKKQRALVLKIAQIIKFGMTPKTKTTGAQTGLTSSDLEAIQFQANLVTQMPGHELKQDLIKSKSDLSTANKTIVEYKEKMRSKEEELLGMKKKIEAMNEEIIFLKHELSADGRMKTIEESMNLKNQKQILLDRQDEYRKERNELQSQIEKMVSSEKKIKHDNEIAKGKLDHKQKLIDNIRNMFLTASGIEDVKIVDESLLSKRIGDFIEKIKMNVVEKEEDLREKDAKIIDLTNKVKDSKDQIDKLKNKKGNVSTNPIPPNPETEPKKQSKRENQSKSPPTKSIEEIVSPSKESEQAEPPQSFKQESPQKITTLSEINLSITLVKPINILSSPQSKPIKPSKQPNQNQITNRSIEPKIDRSTQTQPLKINNISTPQTYNPSQNKSEITTQVTSHNNNKETKDITISKRNISPARQTKAISSVIDDTIISTLPATHNHTDANTANTTIVIKDAGRGETEERELQKESRRQISKDIVLADSLPLQSPAVRSLMEKVGRIANASVVSDIEYIVDVYLKLHKNLVKMITFSPDHIRISDVIEYKHNVSVSGLAGDMSTVDMRREVSEREMGRYVGVRTDRGVVDSERHSKEGLPRIISKEQISRPQSPFNIGEHQKKKKLAENQNSDIFTNRTKFKNIDQNDINYMNQANQKSFLRSRSQKLYNPGESEHEKVKQDGILSEEKSNLRQKSQSRAAHNKSDMMIVEKRRAVFADMDSRRSSQKKIDSPLASMKSRPDYLIDQLDEDAFNNNSSIVSGGMNGENNESDTRNNKRIEQNYGIPDVIPDTMNILSNSNHQNDQVLEKIFETLNRPTIFKTKKSSISAIGHSIPANNNPEFQAFKSKVVKFVELHNKCGSDCPHLRRFYQRFGIFSLPKNYQNKRNYILPVLEIGKNTIKQALLNEALSKNRKKELTTISKPVFI